MSVSPKRTAAFLAGALALMIPFTNNHEGFSLKSYQDVGHVWTVCHGEAGVPAHIAYTTEECKLLDAKQYAAFLVGVSSQINTAVSEQTLAAFTDFAFNIGLKGFSTSATLRLVNGGQVAAGCEAMLDWHTAGGLDCRIRANQCYGIVQRRIDEQNFCLGGINGH